MSLFGVEVNAQVNRLLTEIKLHLAKHKFTPNLRSLYRSFANFDEGITGTISLHHFQKSLNNNGLFFKKHEFQIFLKAYDNGEGKVSWFTFLQNLKKPMNPARRQLIEKIYDFLKTKSQKLTPEAIMQFFRPQQAQGVSIYNQKTASQQHIQHQLISLLSMPEGELTQEQFIAFYDDLNVNFPNDTSFVKYVSQQWEYCPEKYQCVTQENLRWIIKQLRFKLIQKSSGTNDEFLMRKLFTQFDENKNGFISPFELDLMMKRLQLPIPEEAVYPLFEKLDKNKSGNIQYDEFKRFIFFDAFPA